MGWLCFIQDGNLAVLTIGNPYKLLFPIYFDLEVGRFIQLILRVDNKCKEEFNMKVYVGNLPFNVDDEGLKKIFSAYEGVEEVTVIQNKFSGRSKGFGFVTFTNDESAKKAISELNDKDIEGRKLKVNEAIPFDPDKPREPRRNFNRSF